MENEIKYQKAMRLLNDAIYKAISASAMAKKPYRGLTEMAREIDEIIDRMDPIE